MEEGYRFTGKIEHETDLGDGLLMHDGVVVFVPAASKDSEVPLKITRSYEKVAFAKIVREDSDK